MQQAPRRIKRLLREYVAAAHEKELRCAIQSLAELFDQWKDEEISSGELTDHLHEFHQGPARELFIKYNNAMLEVVVAHAVVSGILDRSAIAADVLEHLGNALRFYEEYERPVAAADRPLKKPKSPSTNSG